jgi:hypothetical protein
LHLLGKHSKSVAEETEDLSSVLAEPAGHSTTTARVSDGLTHEELPFILLELFWEDALDKVHAVGETISLEQGSANLRVAKSDQTVRQFAQLFLRVSSLRPGIQSLIEQLDEA